MNFIHRVLFKSVGEGIGTISNKNHIQPQTMKDCLNCIFLFFLFQTFLPNDILNVYKQYHCICVGWTVRLACERVFEFQPRQTKVVKTGSDSSTTKRSEIGVSVTGPRS